jgi:hypothetical protein
MKTVARRRVYHHPFHRLYDPDAHLGSKRNVFLIGAAAIQSTMILSVIQPFILVVLVGDGSPFSFFVEGYCLSLLCYLRGLWIGDSSVSQVTDKLAFGLGILFVMEVPITMLVLLHLIATLEIT